jgi:hypothetical protein
MCRIDLALLLRLGQRLLGQCTHLADAGAQGRRSEREE